MGPHPISSRWWPSASGARYAVLAIAGTTRWWRASSRRSKRNDSLAAGTGHGRKPEPRSLSIWRDCIIEPVSTPPWALSVRWSSNSGLLSQPAGSTESGEVQELGQKAKLVGVSCNELECGGVEHKMSTIMSTCFAFRAVTRSDPSSYWITQPASSGVLGSAGSK